MQNITIGIPRALAYYQYKILWLEYFKNIGVNVILSPPTNKDILKRGTQYVVDEACLSLKVYMGHIDYLKDKVDYVFIPRIACVNKTEKMCTNFLALYDMVFNIFPDIKILSYNVDEDIGYNQFNAHLRLAKQLNVSYLKAYDAYNKAIDENNKYYLKKQNMNKLNLKKANLKILIIAHPYNLEDELIGKPIVNYLAKENINIITPDIFAQKSFENHLSHTIYWTANQLLFSVIEKYKSKVDGMILISTFPCGPDSLCNELIIRKVKNIPILYLLIDENQSDTGIITRLESFIDIIKLKNMKEVI